VTHLNRMEESISYIEQHLISFLNLPDIAQYVYLSPYHFHRMFQVITGESVKTYIRKRRLSLAADDLLHTQSRILDIAIYYGYSSHEAFTRSFKQVTEKTPDQYRTEGVAQFVYPRLSIRDNQVFQQDMANWIQEPQVVSYSSFYVIGPVVTGLNLADSTDFSLNQQKIFSLWEKIDDAKRSAKKQWGILFPTGGMSYEYMAGSTWSDKQERKKDDWFIRKISKNDYIQVLHQGSFHQIPSIFRYLIGFWLPQSEYDLAFAPELELYHQRGKQVDMEILIPVTKKEK
jgi:AraC family transcriptional regulator